MASEAEKYIIRARQQAEEQMLALQAEEKLRIAEDDRLKRVETALNDEFENENKAVLMELQEAADQLGIAQKLDEIRHLLSPTDPESNSGISTLQHVSRLRSSYLRAAVGYVLSYCPPGKVYHMRPYPGEYFNRYEEINRFTVLLYLPNDNADEPISPTPGYFNTVTSKMGFNRFTTKEEPSVFPEYYPYVTDSDFSVKRIPLYRTFLQTLMGRPDSELVFGSSRQNEVMFNPAYLDGYKDILDERLIEFVRPLVEPSK